MPAINARDSSGAQPNIGLIVALVVGAVFLILILVALLIPIFKQRRAARINPPPSTLEQFMSKGDHARVFQKSGRGHHKNDSSGPLLQDTTTNWTPAGQHPRIRPTDLPPLPDNVGHSYGYDGEDEDDAHDYELGPHIQTGPATYAYPRPAPSPPNLRLAIPRSAPNPPKGRLGYQAPAARPPSPHSPSSPVSAADSESMYSVRSVSSRCMHTVDLASPALPPPPVPSLPAYLRARTDPELPDLPVDDLSTPTPPSPAPALPAFLRPLSELPPEEPPLARGDTIVVAGLLKSRAKRLRGTAVERSMTRTERIERADSIREAPSPDEETAQRQWRRPPLPVPTHMATVDSAYSVDSVYTYTRSDSVDVDASFADTLEYYTSQPLTSPTESVDTVRPTRSARAF